MLYLNVMSTNYDTARRHNHFISFYVEKKLFDYVYDLYLYFM